jgi:hypothetical protein
MKDLIDNIITFLKAAITAGDINIDGITINDVYKGYWDTPNTPPRGPYITIDDGGERTELNESNTLQTRYYVIRVEFADYFPDNETSLDNILDFSNQIKTEFEKAANRQKDGMVFGIDISPFEMGDPDDDFWRGRQVIVEYREEEDTFLQY